MAAERERQAYEAACRLVSILSSVAAREILDAYERSSNGRPRGSRPAGRAYEAAKAARDMALLALGAAEARARRAA